MMVVDDGMLLNDLELFYGETTASAARLYARIPGLPGGGEWSLRGVVLGPQCELAATLPAEFAVRDLGVGATLLAQSLITEPVCWTPQTPAIYNVRLQLYRGEAMVAQAERPCGIRRLGARGHSLYFEQRRWVLRGVFADETPESDLDAWRETPAVLVTEQPSDALCSEASRRGTMMVARLSGDSAAVLERELCRLAQHAAVAVVMVRHDFAWEKNPRELAPNVLLAAEFVEPESLLAEGIPPAWAQLAAVHVTDSANLAAIASLALPVLAVRPRGWSDTLAEARRDCDRLQSDLAAVLDCAGYIV